MSLENLKITVLLSVFNDKKYISKAIDSILNQTFTDFELLIVDDCSTDGTVDIIRNYKDPRIKLIINKENIGITKSLNKGLKLARGKYIARQDSDDISNPERLEKQLIFLENSKSYAAVGSWTEVIDENGDIVERWNQERTAEQIFYTLSYRNCLTSSSVMYNKEIISKIGGYDESTDHAEDYDLWYRLSRKYKIYVISEYLVKWRKSKNQLTFKNYFEINNRTLKIVLEKTKINKKLLEYLLDREKEKSFFKKIKLIKELYKFHVNVQNEGKNAKLNRLKLKLVCFKMTLVFILKIFINKKMVHFIKKIFRMN